MHQKANTLKAVTGTDRAKVLEKETMSLNHNQVTTRTLVLFLCLKYSSVEQRYR